MKAAAHLADFVQGGVFGDGAVHLQLIAGLPIFLPLMICLWSPLATGAADRAGYGGSDRRSAGESNCAGSWCEQHPAGTPPCSAHGSVLSESRSAPCRWSLGRAGPPGCRPCSARATSSLWLSGAQAVLLRADHPADEIAFVHAGGKLPPQDLTLIAQHVEVVDDGPFWPPEGGYRGSTQR